jgi:hypothetical protein
MRSLPEQTTRIAAVSAAGCSARCSEHPLGREGDRLSHSRALTRLAATNPWNARCGAYLQTEIPCTNSYMEFDVARLALTACQERAVTAGSFVASQKKAKESHPVTPKAEPSQPLRVTINSRSLKDTVRSLSQRRRAQPLQRHRAQPFQRHRAQAARNQNDLRSLGRPDHDLPMRCRPTRAGEPGACFPHGSRSSPRNLRSPHTETQPDTTALQTGITPQT